MGSKLSQYDYSILTLKCVNLIQEKTRPIVGVVKVVKLVKLKMKSLSEL